MFRALTPVTFLMLMIFSSGSVRVCGLRWVMERKVEVLAAVRSGLLSIDDACKRYAISMEEFLTWKSAMDRFGPLGLRATRDFRSERPG